MARLFFMLGFAIIFTLTQLGLQLDIGVANDEPIDITKDKAEETNATGTESIEQNKPVVLKDIFVTATRTEKDISSAPGSISVVTKKDIEKRNIQNVDQALNALPGLGVFDSRVKLVEYLPQITLRGMPYGRGRTLVVMDGINLVDPMYGNLYGLAGLAPETVERIEVVRGPFSSLYGGQAMGGVVNIITKTPEKREFTINSGYGSSWVRGEAADDLRKFYLSYGDKFKDKLSIFLSYRTKSANGFPTMYNIQATQPSADISGWSNTTDAMGNARYLIGDKGDTTWWDDNITLKAGCDFSETSKINLSFYRSRWETHWDDPHTFLKDAEGKPVWSYGSVGEDSFLYYDDMSREQNFYNMTYETEISEVKSKLSFSYVDSIFRSGIPGSESTRSGGPGTGWYNPLDRHFNTELQFTTPPLFERHILTFGGFFGHISGEMGKYNRTDWMDEDTRTNLIYQSKGKDRTYALFVQDDIMILDNVTVYIGFRQDWWETYDGSVFQQGFPDISYDSNAESSFNPKAAIVYKPFEKTTLRASAGKAFRAPTILELYGTFTNPNGTTYAGNPNLKPETTKSWDIGAEQTLWKGAKIKAAYFENYMEDFIYQSMTTPTLYQNDNVGKAESKGVELEAEQGFGDWLRLFANFTYTDSEVTENSAKPEIEGKSLTMLPDKMFNIGAELTRDPFSASFVGRYVSKIYKNDANSDDVEGVYGSYDPYFVADTKVSYDITNFAKLSFSVDNIFDEDYFYYDKSPGRSWFAELTLKF